VARTIIELENQLRIDGRPWGSYRNTVQMKIQFFEGNSLALVSEPCGSCKIQEIEVQTLRLTEVRRRIWKLWLVAKKVILLMNSQYMKLLFIGEL
jgi:hypothetical protein